MSHDRTPPKKKAKELAKYLWAEKPDYAYLKSVFRALRGEMEIEIPKAGHRLLEVPTEEELRQFYQTVWQTRNVADMILVSFDEVDANGRQALQLHALTGGDARADSAAGKLLLEGRTGETATGPDTRLWAGRIGDPFYVDLSLLGIFTERLPRLTQSCARMTNRLCAALEALGHATSGEAGARLSERLGMPVTPFCLLQLLRKTVLLLIEVRVVGIDDWCWKKGTTYGTIIVDLETRQPNELLPDRSVETVEAWLRSHPKITIVSRDRGGDYAAARNGAPQAEQIADRFHLLLNLRAKLKDVIVRHHKLLPMSASTRSDAVSQKARGRSTLFAPPTAEEQKLLPLPPPEPTPSKQRASGVPSSDLLDRANRAGRSRAVKQLWKKGKSIRFIAKHLNMSRVTVRCYLKDAPPPDKPAPLGRKTVAQIRRAARAEQVLQLREQGGESLYIAQWVKSVRRLDFIQVLLLYLQLIPDLSPKSGISCKYSRRTCPMDDQKAESHERSLIPTQARHASPLNEKMERATFETALEAAGQAANEGRQHDIFSEYYATCRPNTLKRQFYDLRCLCEFLSAQKQVRLTPLELALSAEAWRGMTYGLLADFRTWMLQQGFSIGTMNNRLATVRKFCQLAGPPPKGIGVISEQDLTTILTISGYAGKIARNVDQHRVRNKTPTRVGNKKADFTRLSVQDMAQLQRTTTPPPPPERFVREHDQVLQARDAVMWSLLDEHLLRVSELVTLAIENIDLEEKTITVYREKGDETWVYEMGPQTEANLRVYLKQLQALERESGPLFLGYGGKQMTTSAINKRVGKLGEQLGFGKSTGPGKQEKSKGKPKQRLSPHDLRHHGAITLLNEGTPLNELQAIGGWRTAHMPLQYARLSKDAIIRSPKRHKKPSGEE